MALIWHDWFATSNDKVNDQKMMRAQTQLFRDEGLGSFQTLLEDVTRDPAMLLWLDGIYNDKDAPNENYGREVMELFTLGAGRGAYSEDDVREMARALTGWVVDYSDQLGYHNFHFDPDRHDTDPKTIFGQTGNYDWRDALRLCVEHPLHASFFVSKLWSYFLPDAPSAGTQADLERIYVSSGHQIRPVVEAILMHPDLYQGPSHVKPPVVFAAGLLRTLEDAPITTEAWIWDSQDAGQRLHYPPNVSGWNDKRWLDTSTLHGRWDLATTALDDRYFDPWDDQNPYDPTEDEQTALQSALTSWHNPPLSAQTLAALTTFANNALPPGTDLAEWQQSPYRAMRQNALRQLIAIAPDNQVS